MSILATVYARLLDDTGRRRPYQMEVSIPAAQIDEVAQRLGYTRAQGRAVFALVGRKRWAARIAEYGRSTGDRL